MSELNDYKQKRRFGRTPEPKGEKRRSATGRVFVVQKHRASHLHYDFRLEDRGVLKSWAIPKGPSLDPAVKRLAMAVEDHPLDYAEFEGVIPEGEYGGGTVMLWDRGDYQPEGIDDVEAAMRKGDFKFVLNGSKLKGSWVMVRTRNNQWLLIKHRDGHASTEDVTVSQPTSVATGRTLAEIAAQEGGDVDKAATGDPPTSSRTGPRKSGRGGRRAGPRSPVGKTLRKPKNLR
jgi:bifunctional non-homologous end joining protein LigD